MAGALANAGSAWPQRACDFAARLWGRALDAISGLDPRHMIPPVADVIDQMIAAFEGHRMLFATQVYENSLQTPSPM